MLTDLSVCLSIYLDLCDAASEGNLRSADSDSEEFCDSVDHLAMEEVQCFPLNVLKMSTQSKKSQLQYLPLTKLFAFIRILSPSHFSCKADVCITRPVP